MSSMAETFRFMFKKHKISIGGLQEAVRDGVITQEEYEEIVAEGQEV